MISNGILRAHFRAPAFRYLDGPCRRTLRVAVHPFLTRVESTLLAQGLLPDGTRCVVAVSGGCDSMLLLHVLAVLRTRHPWNFIVAHLNHQLRGAHADEDQQAVAIMAEELQVPFFHERRDVSALRAAGESLEEAARRERHAFLVRVAHETGCDRIATGHHADDQAELFLMRLLRGTGGSGWGGMAFRDPSPADPGIPLVRPFLEIPREEIVAACRDLGIHWREDESNLDGSMFRNRVRLELIPFLVERFQPGLRKVLGRSQALLRDQASLVKSLARNWLSNPGESFETLHAAVQREVIVRQLEDIDASVRFDLVEDLRLHPGRVVQLDPTRRVHQVNGRLETFEARTPLPAHLPDECVLDLGLPAGCLHFGGLRLEWRVDANLGTAIEEVANTHAATGTFIESLDAEAVGNRVRLRHWRPGDRFQPIGLSQPAKLQDLFTNAHVPVAERRRRVVAESAAIGLFWVEGLRLGAGARIHPRTRRRVLWKWTRLNEFPGGEP
jgi:tRNA(Ile)-lysidine synthase